MQKICALALLCLICNMCYAQTENELTDSLYIQEVQTPTPAKILHAEPLYIDLIRDLGARKGEHEWNIGMGITDNLNYDTYQMLVEYEWAPVNRLGLELEVPLTMYAPLKGTASHDVPSHRVESVKAAMQYTFLVSQRYNTSMALGYINELVLTDLEKMRRQRIVTGNIFNPFFVAAKRWGNNFHTLIYTGPHLAKEFTGGWHSSFAINTNIHYMIPGTRNFVGIELNKDIADRTLHMVVRPQLRVSIADNLMIGIVAGVPISREDQRFSSFARLIWEPGHKHD